MTTPLPPPRPLSITLGDALRGRASCRAFRAEPLRLADLATVLDAAYGVGGRVSVAGFDMRERPVPSAGARYPLELFVVARDVEDLRGGVYHYAARHHRLDARSPAVSGAEVSRVFLRQPWVAAAPALVIVAAELERTTARYGDRGYRYVLLEVGHVGQNVALAATALSLGTLSLGGFLDSRLHEHLGLQPRVVVLYALALGRPLGDSRVAPEWKTEP